MAHGVPEPVIMWRRSDIKQKISEYHLISSLNTFVCFIEDYIGCLIFTLQFGPLLANKIEILCEDSNISVYEEQEGMLTATCVLDI